MSARRAMRNAVATNGASRLAVAFTPFITTPILARDLEPQAYGAYVVVAAAAALLPVAELGVSLALVTLLARLRGDDTQLGARYTASAFFFLQLVAGVVVLAVVVASLVTDWSGVLGTGDSVPEEELQRSVLIAATCVAIGLPANVVYKTALGLGRSTAPALWQLLAMPIVIAGCIGVAARDGGLAWFTAAVFVPPALVAAAVSVWQFTTRHAAYRPRWSRFSPGAVRTLLGAGAVFTISAAATAVAVQTDALVIAHVLGTEQSAEYSLAARVSSVALILGQGLCLPLWPAFGQALTEQGVDGARRLLRNSTVAALGMGATFAVGYILGARFLIELWVGPEYSPSLGLILALGLLALLQGVLLPSNVLLASLRATRFIGATSAGMVLVNVPLSLLLAHRLGTSGPAWASVVAYTVFVGAPTAWYLPRVLGRSPEASADAGAAMSGEHGAAGTSPGGAG